MLSPLNTEWNRKTGMLPNKGQVNFLGIKYGIVYFTWTATDGAITFLQADEGVFKKHFNFNGPVAEEIIKLAGDKLTLLVEKKTKFLKYPFEVA